MNELASVLFRPGSRGLRTVLFGLLGLGVFGYAAFLWRQVSPIAGGTDSSGYLNSARLFSEGRLFASPRVLSGFSTDELGASAHLPVGFITRADGRMVPSYPMGYPLQLLVAAGFGWSRAVPVLNVITALVSGGLLFALCRQLRLTVGIALGGVALLWACPLFIFSAVQPMSDLSALAWTLLALYAALRGPERWFWALLCGAAVGFAVLVRPTNSLLLVPVLVAIGFRLRSWLMIGLGGLPFAACLGYYNWQLFGSPFNTGYGNLGDLFGTETFGHNVAHFALWIPLLLSPLIGLALASPCTVAGRERGLVVLGVWAVVLIGLYLFYACAGETWWYLRFILPAFPALIVGALVVLETAWRKYQTRIRFATIGLGFVFLAGVCWELLQVRRLEVLRTKESEHCYLDSARWAQRNLPAQSVVFCMQVSGAYFYYTDFSLLRWDLVLPEKFGPMIQTLERQNRPVYAALFPYEKSDALARIGGRWTELATVGQVTFWQQLP